jgi:acetyl esterase/lipase
MGVSKTIVVLPFGSRQLAACLVVLLAYFASMAAAGNVPAKTARADRPLLEYAYGSHNLHKGNLLDLHYPDEGTKPYPLIVCIHAGSWGAGDKSQVPIKKLLDNGFAVATINYRLLSEGIHFPVPVQDCKLAIAILRKRAVKLQIDPNRIGVWGMSAGGYLAALVGTTADLPSPKWAKTYAGSNKIEAMCLWCAPTDLREYIKKNPAHLFLTPAVRILLGCPPEACPKVARAASPITYVNRSSAPCLIVHGDRDKCVDISQAQSFHDALKAAGAQVDLKVFHGSGHDLYPEAIDDTVSFFKQALSVSK